MASQKGVLSRLSGEKNGQQANRWGHSVSKTQFLTSLKGYIAVNAQTILLKF